MVGRRITAVEVFGDRTLRRHTGGRRDFIARLAGRRVVAARRRGKFLWLPLDDGIEPARPSRDVRPVPRGRRRMRRRAAICGRDGASTTAGRELRFCDQRTFGGLALADDGLTADGVPTALAHVAPDPLEPAFDASAVRGGAAAAAYRGSSGRCSTRRLISGIGNIYADEALWRAKLHFARPTDRMRRPEVDRVLGAVDEVLRAAIAGWRHVVRRAVRRGERPERVVRPLAGGLWAGRSTVLAMWDADRPGAASRTVRRTCARRCQQSASERTA